MNRRRPHVEFTALLRGSELAEGLVPDDVGELADVAQATRLEAGMVLFHEGATPDGAYVLVSGRLAASRAGKPLGQMGRGELVGEMGILSNTPRGATVKALRDSELLFLPASALRSCVETVPRIGWNLAKLIARRLETRQGLRVPTVRTIAVFGAPGGVPASALFSPLFDAFQPHGSVIAMGPSDGRDLAAARVRLHQAERANATVLLLGDGDEPWRRFCERCADRAILVVRAQSPKPVGLEAEALLVVCVDRAGKVPSWTSAGARCHLVVPDLDGAAIARIARIAKGQARGVVLGGGAARALAHVGVVRALLDAGQPIDAIGGTSSGALVAALFAMGLSPAAVREKLAGLGGSPFGDQGYKASGQRLERVLLDLFGDRRIEELVLPWFAVSTSLDRGSAVVHRSGLVRDALRASMAVPGVVPAVACDGDWLVDGGVVDNVPVSAMRTLIDGHVTAVNVGSRRAIGAEGAPSASDVLLRTVELSTRTGAAANADVLITPDLTGFGSGDWTRVEVADRVGYDAMNASLRG